ncbi:hypothetical protein AVEN_32110-1 [Araneus ventricosus]|uniref:Uncharacterized protein n=1 Tax=Araneus ventricosus TaxID=182803 RepID=A0A4Y2GGS4_ARAVE|nr:hypothetical protein AVEN_32110-1 [Araneus ventricosus]
MQIIIVARGFWGWLDRSSEMSVNARTSNTNESTDGDFSTLCRLCRRYRNGGTGRIPNDSKSPSLISSNQASDLWNKTLSLRSNFHFWCFQSFCPTEGFSQPFCWAKKQQKVHTEDATLLLYHESLTHGLGQIHETKWY